MGPGNPVVNRYPIAYHVHSRSQAAASPKSRVTRLPAKVRVRGAAHILHMNLSPPLNSMNLSRKKNWSNCLRSSCSCGVQRQHLYRYQLEKASFVNVMHGMHGRTRRCLVLLPHRLRV